jgi:predicted regulator of Ras-like GTPase activity (Roadblock/LC7/MglB family)
MSPNVTASLASLRDVDGIVGSFVVSAEGALLARDLPQMFDNELLGEIGPRIRRMAEGLSETGESPSSIVLHFKDHKLWLKPSADFTLCVLGALQVNRPALRMALTLVSRRVAPLLGAASPSTVPGPPTTPAPAPGSVRAPETLLSTDPYEPTVASHSRRGLYRGRTIDD